MRERDMRGGSIAAERIGGHGSPRVFAPGRVCAHHGCKVRLSIYNGAECCALHDMSAISSRPPRGTARRYRSNAGRQRVRAA